MSVSVGYVIMASGEGKRFGSQKLLARFKGRRIIEYAADKICLFDRYVVVTRDKKIADMFENSILHNEPQRSGAVKIGTGFLSECDGICFMAADQPLLTKESTARLINEFIKNPKRIYRLGFNGEGGNPVIFPKKFYGELMNLSGKNGGSAVVTAHFDECVIVPVQNEYELKDIDKKEDIEKLNISGKY